LTNGERYILIYVHFLYRSRYCLCLSRTLKKSDSVFLSCEFKKTRVGKNLSCRPVINLSYERSSSYITPDVYANVKIEKLIRNNAIISIWISMILEYNRHNSYRSLSLILHSMPNLCISMLAVDWNLPGNPGSKNNMDYLFNVYIV